MTTLAPEWTDLAGRYEAAGTEAEREAILAETAQRERAEKARRQRKIEAMRFEDALQAQLEDATRVCKGHLVGARGLAVNGGKGLPDERMLWRGPERIARQLASEELNAYWDANPRVCLSQYQQQERDGRRIQRDERDAQEISQDREETVNPLGAAGHIAGHVARDAGRAAELGTREAIYAQRRQAVTARAQEMAGQLHAQVAVRQPATVMRGRTMVDAPALLRRTLESIGLLYTDYVAFPSRSAVIAVTTWTGQAAARDADGDSIWRAYVRLLLTSRENGSGKSTVADITRMLLMCRAGRMSKVTPYGLTKVLGIFKETAIADDAQNVFRSDKAGTDLLTIMINGYTPGATWVSGKGGDGKVEPASGPLMIVGKDALIKERAESLKDLIDRSAVVRMERPDHYMPEFDEEGEARARSLGVTLKAVTGALQGELRQAARDLAKENQGRLITDGDGGRTAQIWRPMLAVARVAGDQWYDATLQAMEDLSSAGGDLLKADEALAALEDLRDDGRSFWDAVPGSPAHVADEDYDEISEEE